nr:MAG: ORF1 [TTV-like mini virus]
MPPWTYRRRWRRKRPWRPWHRRRRPRPTFQRTFWRRRRRVRKRYYKRYFKKKLKKITLKEWQPKTIRKCAIKGDLCLFACGKYRITHNYTLYSESMVPEGEPGGGAWSIMQLTLRALWDEYVHYRNWWTKSNDGLPLVRYNYCKFKFYRAKECDYIVTPVLTPPFNVGRDDYLNTHPIRALMNRNKIIITKQKPGQRKNYIKRKFWPPALWKTKWYFQQDICNMPFIVLKVTACDFDQFYQPKDMLSYNITLYALNTFFQNPKFEEKGETGYSPKLIPDGTNKGKPYYLYGTETGPSNESETKWMNLTFLGNTNIFTRGTSITQNYQKSQWGNIFHPAFTSPDSRIYYSHTPVSEAAQKYNQKAESITRLHYIFQACRYNPMKDKGTGNKVYFKSTTLDQGTFDILPSKTDILIEDFPLWLIFWGWTDWLRKLHPINHIETEYLYVVKSDYITPKQPWYVFLDWYFVDAKHEQNQYTETEKANWHPRYEFQEEAEFYIGQSGPGTPKINDTKCIQANCNYSFHVKWGGTPPNMETFTDPCLQEKYPIPNNINQTDEIKNPELPKETFLYEWDERGGLLTAPAAKRIKTYESPKKSFTDYGPRDVPNQTQETESDEETSEEETKTPLKAQIQLLKQQQRKLKRQLLRHRLTKQYLS